MTQCAAASSMTRSRPWSRLRGLQSRYFHVLAPSRCRTRVSARMLESRFLALMPRRADADFFTGSQCVTQPQFLQRTKRIVRSPHT
jgi:hypothetical protein